MEWTARWAAIAALGLVGVAAPAVAEGCGDNGNCNPNLRRYAIAVYCNKAEVSDAETNDTLTLTAWNDSEYTSLASSVGVVCSRWYNPSQENAFFNVGDFEKPPTHLVLEIDGDDAFFADWITVSEVAFDRWGAATSETQIAQFGAPGARGFCLSRDPADHSGDWATASDSCDAAIELNLKHQAVYGSTPTDLALWQIALDCSHVALKKRTTPWATTTIRVYDSAGQVIEQRSREPQTAGAAQLSKAEWLDRALACPSDETNWTNESQAVLGLGSFIARDVAAIEIEVGPLSPLWAYYEPKEKDARLFIDQLKVVKNRFVEVAHWDVDGLTGWCLTQYPEILDGAWLALSMGGCQPGFRFAVASQTWTSLPRK